MRFVIEHEASPAVRQAITDMGRTEDVCFAPDGRRLAVAAFNANRIALFDVDVTSSPAGPRVALTKCVTLTSPALKKPHGVAFADADTVVVASREGDVDVFRVPGSDAECATFTVHPLHTWRVNGTCAALRAPSAVTVSRLADGRFEVLVCNNDTHTVTRHWLQPDGMTSDGPDEILLDTRLAVPDSVTVSPDRQWVAVSNHGTSDVLLYRLSALHTAGTEPEGILKGLRFPHGLRFTPDGSHLFVADAEAPLIHVFAEEGAGWRGIRYPAASVRVMEDEAFRRGHESRGNGGPKGLELTPDARILVTSCEHQPLAFLDAPAVLQSLSLRTAHDTRPGREFEYELVSLEQRRLNALQLTRTETLLGYIRNSRSWRSTGWLRRLDSVLRRPRD